jgi:hypothetical protein
MRQFRSLFKVEKDDTTGILNIVGEKGTHDYPSLMVKREGDYVPISVSYGPIELALRLRYEALARTITRLQPVNGLQTTRQVGSTSAYLAMGLQSDGTLLLRPTLVTDARGYLVLNLSLPPEVKAEFLAWLEIPTTDTSLG